MTQAATTAEAPPAAAPAGRAFGWAYWMLNVIEMFERLAYFGIRAVVPLYIMQATEPGGLHLTAVHKGVIYFWWAVFQSFLPIVTGGIADRYGYKRVLTGAISANVVGYVLMATLHSYAGFFAGVLVLATGTAFFKPALQGSIAQNLTRASASLGWGVFYWVVNVGAFAAPFVSTAVLGKPHSAEGWTALFHACAGFSALNLLLLLTFRDVPSGASKSESIMQVLGRTVANVWPYWFVGGRFAPRRGSAGVVLMLLALGALLFGLPGSVREPLAGLAPWLPPAVTAATLVLGLLLATWLEGGVFAWQLRLPVWLLIMSCFWMMMYQLWDLHPNFITDWVDSAMLVPYMPVGTWWEYGETGLPRVQQQILLNLNAGLIILLILPLSWAASRMRTLSAMLVGMSIATVGVLVSGMTGNGLVLLLGIVFFSLGEMWTGPKKNEYLGLIAPPGKKALYLGYVNIPVGVGVSVGSFLAGHVYDAYGEKASLALKELGRRPALLARAAQGGDWSDSLAVIPALAGIAHDAALATVQSELGLDPDQARRLLHQTFRHDQGQLINLGLLHLAQHPDYRARVAHRLAAERPAAPAAAPAAADLATLARHLDRLPEWLGIKRFEVLRSVRERVNAERAEQAPLDISEVEDWLWDKYANDPAALNGMALEYLAQGSGRVREAVARLQLPEPVADIPRLVGIDRTESFDALSRALGVEDAELERTLAEALPMPGASPSDRVYVFLARQEHLRFRAVGRRDWSAHRALLATLLAGDELAATAAERAAGREVSLDEIAADQALVQAALKAKDWSRAPEHAAALLLLNPLEARAVAAAEINRAALEAQRLLWQKYDPQYRVWLPFVGIGVLATIALGIFGQMAKRWQDMNA